MRGGAFCNELVVRRRVSEAAERWLGGELWVQRGNYDAAAVIKRALIIP